MKKSELRKIIREEIKNIHEQPSSFVCMNLFSTADAIDDGQSGLNSSEGYCVNTMIGGGGSLHQQFQDAGFGTYTMHSTLEECISSYNAGGNCNQGYEHSVYPPPSGGPGPFVGGNPIKGPIGNTIAPASKKATALKRMQNARRTTRRGPLNKRS